MSRTSFESCGPRECKFPLETTKGQYDEPAFPYASVSTRVSWGSSPASAAVGACLGAATSGREPRLLGDRSVAGMAGSAVHREDSASAAFVASSRSCGAVGATFTV